MLYLPYLFWHVSRIRNHLHVVGLRKPIGWCYDSDQNINDEHRKSHSASCPLDTKCGSYASQPEPPTSCTNPSNLSLQLLSSTFTSTIFTTTISIRTGPGPCSIYTLFLPHQRTKHRDSLPLFWKKGRHWIFHQQMLLIYEWPKIRIPWWRCQDLLDPFVHTDWFCQDMVWLCHHINIQGTAIILNSDELLKKINWKFIDTDKRTTQLLKIRTIQQGDRSADKYIQEFEKAALEAGYEGYPPVLWNSTSFLYNQNLKRE